MTLHAVIDESTRGQRYLICATTISSADLGPTRAALPITPATRPAPDPLRDGKRPAPPFPSQGNVPPRGSLVHLRGGAPRSGPRSRRDRGHSNHPVASSGCEPPRPPRVSRKPHNAARAEALLEARKAISGQGRRVRSFGRRRHVNRRGAERAMVDREHAQRAPGRSRTGRPDAPKVRVLGIASVPSHSLYCGVEWIDRDHLVRRVHRDHIERSTSKRLELSDGLDARRISDCHNRPILVSQVEGRARTLTDEPFEVGFESFAI